MKHSLFSKIKGIFSSPKRNDSKRTNKESSLLDKDSASGLVCLNSSILPNIVVSSNGNIISANQAFRKMVGSKDESLKSSFLDYLDDNSKDVFQNNIEQKSDKDKEIELKLDNDVVTHVLAYLLATPKSDVVNCVLIDITPYKNLEFHLIHSQKMQAVGQLAGGISHDFNNLLTAIIGFSDLLLMKHPAGDPSFVEIMQIKQNSNRAANLVRQLLAISRKQVLKPMVLDITNTVEELVNLIRRLIGNNVSLTINHAQDLKMVKVDQGQLEQVIINLAVNARDAILAVSDSGSLSISTSNVKITSDSGLEEGFISPDDENILPGEYVLISVKDSGSGIPKSIIKKIFEPFFSTKDIGAGTGLGLSTVHGIIKQTGGYLFLKSEENKGTTFNIYFKASEQQENKNSIHASNVFDNKIMQRDLTGNATILLVEDEMPVRMFACSALSKKGYNVLEADCPDAALKAITQYKGDIDLVLTDVLMPGMTGPAMIKEIRKKTPNVRVIFMSGYAEDAFTADSNLEQQSNDFHFISKPFTLKQLAAKIKDVLEA